MSAESTARGIREERLLRISLLSVLFLAMASIFFGIWARSSAITFDGFYSLADAGLTLLALFVARLIVRDDDRRFQYGYWHIEPLLGLVSGSILTITCAYAFIDGVQGLRGGGGETHFEASFVFTGLAGLFCLGMFAFNRRSARGLDSEFVQIDARGWLIGGIISVSLCLSFLVGYGISYTRFARFAPFVDPTVLIIVSLGLIPFSMTTLWRAAAGILQIAPPELDRTVRDIAGATAARHGFGGFTSHVARVGRQYFIEIGLVAPSADFVKNFGELDEIRSELAKAINQSVPRCWLTVDFTADKRWI